MHILHFVSLSATDAQISVEVPETTACTVSRAAQRLADERGLDGFTMEELAAAVGVSRRTLFNHVPGKVDAVLGGGLPTEPEIITEFRQGGPTGHLVTDIREVGAAILRLRQRNVDDVARMQRLLRSDPRLFKAMLDRLGRITDLLSEAILEREGSDFDPLRARMLARVSLLAFETAADEFVKDPGTAAADHYIRIFDIVIDLFRPGPD